MFPCEHEKSNDWEYGNCSLSLQSHEKGIRAGNIKTGGAKIVLPPEKINGGIMYE